MRSFDRAYELITSLPTGTPTERVEPAEEPIGPVLYDTTLSTDKGLWLRAGGTGRE